MTKEKLNKWKNMNQID